MTKLIDLPRDLQYQKLTHGFFEDFNLFVAALETATEQSGWRMSFTAGQACTITGMGVVGGEVDIVTTGVDNVGTVLHTDEEVFLAAANKGIAFGCRFKYTEANTDDANVYVGVGTVVDENLFMGDNGTGPPATYDGVCLFKVDGGTTWNVETSFDTGQTTTVLSAANSLDKLAKTPGGGTYTLFEFELIPNTSTTCDVMFYLDGVHVARHTNVTMTSPAAMYALAGMKAGGANAETLTVDYIYCYQTR